MAEAERLQQWLLAAQNSDGGWGYQKGSSWTEPTALALLALTATGSIQAPCAAAEGWLLGSQKPDGGWAPQPSIDQSTWVTSLATLAIDPEHFIEPHRRGLSWLIRQMLPADDPITRFVARFQGTAADFRPFGGSPWFPGTAAWIGPTAMCLLALSEQSARTRENLKSYVSAAQQFILSRRCDDGGWNHGGAKYRSQNASSYPEMTGMALLALRDADPSELLFPIERAIAFLRKPTSSEALSWLQLGLLAHGHDYCGIKADLPCRNVREVSLRLLALAGRSIDNKFLRTRVSTTTL